MKRVALVTGGNRGIGRETCAMLADEGMRVVLTARDAGAGERAAEELRSDARDIVFRRLDVADRGSIDEAIAWVRDEMGRLDVLVNNAAVLVDHDERLLDIDANDFTETIRTNLEGPFHLCRAAVPLMEAGGYGRIVNVSSDYGSITRMTGRNGAYRVSKAALNALTRIVADEVDADTIKVNAVCPGWVRTEMGGSDAERSIREGASSVVWAALLPDDGPTSGFFRDGEPQQW